jgi:hypothetical protein
MPKFSNVTYIYKIPSNTREQSQIKTKNSFELKIVKKGNWKQNAVTSRSSTRRKEKKSVEPPL